MKVKLNPEKKQINEYVDFTLGKIYDVIGICADDFRIINDEGRPYLYPAELFIIVDSCDNDDWITKYGEDGERYSYPECFNKAGFFEDYFDGIPEAVLLFNKYIKEYFKK